MVVEAEEEAGAAEEVGTVAAVTTGAVIRVAHWDAAGKPAEVRREVAAAVVRPLLWVAEQQTLGEAPLLGPMRVVLQRPMRGLQVAPELRWPLTQSVLAVLPTGRRAAVREMDTIDEAASLS